ncbi:hypothetical protein DICPUDRAFT_88977 [Dictyostelium purpureum]|uniref:U-box domain-containing protein n=1 Tax=Dictyostelium purpureum TaxID=5786 RepID=F0ZSX2_DICPU|nr:uncharacterized protein DICPUDRAFT_88977 [Dictyostelium purpureum]EGC32952.1 hypothetical protein DICPUDRAFT_88977 [Dictyostelium purpureum]|eukprot:XP_003290518.1 hypothetical protein DICPUDRAFT_88977 [Dictyostelium purpureum]
MENDIFLDPLTLEVMIEPVISKCGHSFSKESITEWLLKKKTCPICNNSLQVDELTPNYTLRDIIKHMESQPQQSQPQQHDQNQKSIHQPQQLQTQEASVILERATRDDIFMKFFFGNVSYKITAGQWFCEKMLAYAVTKARVWGVFEADKTISGVMVVQPPHDVNGISIAQMVKVGMLGAPFHLGFGPLTRILKSSDFAERIHRKEMGEKNHYYLNCIAIDPKLRRAGRGRELIKKLLDIVDSQEDVSVYTECDLEFSEFFKKQGFAMSRYYKQHNKEEAPFFYTMIRSKDKKINNNSSI